MLRDLAPSDDGAVRRADRRADRRAGRRLLRRRARSMGLPSRSMRPPPAARRAGRRAPQTLSLLDVVEAAEKKTSFSVGVCAEPATALRLPLTPELRALLEDAAVPKRTHDWKLALHLLGGAGRCVARRGRRHDAALLRAQSHARHAVAGRCGRAPRAARALHAGRGRRCHPRAGSRAARRSREGRRGARLREIDLPLAPVLFRMEQAGVRIDLGVLDGLSKRFAIELERVGERIFELAGRRFNINSPKQLGEVLFTASGPARARQPRQRQSRFHRAGCARASGREARRPAPGSRIPPSCPS